MMANMLDPKYMLIGSRALDYWLNLGLVKDSTDFDIISTKPIEGAEWHDPYLLNNHELTKYTSTGHAIVFNGKVVHVVNLIGLALIKRSHLWRDIGFGKHITMYHKHLAKCLKDATESDLKFLKERTEQTMKRFPQQGPNLNQTVEDFFDDAVTKKIFARRDP